MNLKTSPVSIIPLLLLPLGFVIIKFSDSLLSSISLILSGLLSAGGLFFYEKMDDMFRKLFLAGATVGPILGTSLYSDSLITFNILSAPSMVFFILATHNLFRNEERRAVNRMAPLALSIVIPSLHLLGFANQIVVVGCLVLISGLCLFDIKTPRASKSKPVKEVEIEKVPAFDLED